MRRLGVGVVVVLSAGLGAAPALAAEASDVQSFCTASAAVDKEFSKDKPRVAKINRLLDRLAQTAPPEIAEPVRVAVPAFKGNPETAFEDPAVAAAVQRIEEFEYAQCTDAQVDVTLQDFAFVGVPDQVAQGKVGFRLVNEGAEFHEFIVFRLKGDDSLSEILELPRREAAKSLSEVGSGFVEPGATSYAAIELNKAGRYGAVCFLPVGSTDEEAAQQAEEADAAPHYAEGMLIEFQVS